MDIYRRIYRLSNKNVPAGQIAMTLGLPLSNVREIIKKLNDKSQPAVNSKSETKITTNKVAKITDNYLDIYIFQKSRSTVFDLTGFASDKHRVKLKIELNKLDRSDPKIVAILLKNLTLLDMLCYNQIKKFCTEHAKRGRFVAFLDPSPEMEIFINENNIEKEIPVFGTIGALEAKAFSSASK